MKNEEKEAFGFWLLWYNFASHGDPIAAISKLFGSYLSPPPLSLLPPQKSWVWHSQIPIDTLLHRVEMNIVALAAGKVAKSVGSYAMLKGFQFGGEALKAFQSAAKKESSSGSWLTEPFINLVFISVVSL